MTSLTRREAMGAFAAFAGVASTASDTGGRNMFLSLNSVMVSDRVHWPEFAELAARAGYPGCDVMLDPAMKAGAAPTRQLGMRFPMFSQPKVSAQ